MPRPFLSPRLTVAALVASALPAWGQEATPRQTNAAAAPNAPAAGSAPPVHGTAPASTPSPPPPGTTQTTEPAAHSAPLVYTLEGVEVRGNTRTRESVVRRYVPFRVGHVIDAEDEELALVRYRLLGTGYFRDAQLSLEKGSQPGYVVLVVEVVERNTVVVNDVWMGLAADADNQGNARPLTAFAGADVAETNLFGTGITLGGAMALAHEQLALRLNVLDPALVGNEWRGRATLLFNDAKDFFGNAQTSYSDPGDAGPRKDYAVVRYERFGGVAGIGRDLSVPAHLWLNYRLEAIDASLPLQASHLRGVDNVEPIDFGIQRGRSHLSTLGAALRFDTRDHPFLPTRGWLVDASTEFGLLPLGSDYDYQRFDLRASRWWQLNDSGHVLRLELLGGAIAGDAPFFERYFVGDYSDFLPSRILGVNFDRRPPPNFLGTQIVEVRYGTYAGRIGAEYRVPLYRGSRSIYGIDLFAGGGLYAVADEASLLRPAPGYSGLARIPLDLTANFGVRLDTSAGGFVFALSNVLYFIPVRGEGPAGE